MALIEINLHTTEAFYKITQDNLQILTKADLLSSISMSKTHQRTFAGLNQVTAINDSVWLLKEKTFLISYRLKSKSFKKNLSPSLSNSRVQF